MSWLRNLQGQLTELANEVLSEATEEVADPESELQVASKKATEAEQQLVAEKGKVDLLEKKCADLEQNLLDSHTELDMSRAKFESMINSRDHELKKLRIEMEQIRSQIDEAVLSTPKVVSSDTGSRDKALALLSDVQAQLEALRSQKDNEISAIMEQHSQTLQELRENYEEKLRNLEASFPPSTSQSGISIIGSTTTEHPDLSAFHDELENLALTQSGELQSEVNRREEELSRMQQRIHELTDANLALSDRLEEQSTQLSGYESLKRQTAELTRAYNDLNSEYEVYKESNGGIAVRNQDLIQRIDTLRANLIEYEERYEQCRREHTETEKQLQQLTDDFISLKDSVDVRPVDDELNRMKAALESSKNEGSLLKTEVERFRDTVVMFEEELEELRVLNRRLIEDNEKLSGTIREIQNDPSEDKYEKVIAQLKEERDALRNKNNILEEKCDLMAQYQNLTQDNDANEKERADLLEQKVMLLEQVRDGLKERLSELESQESSQSLESLTKQLKEALASNSEKTDECEKLRADLEEQKKEIGVRQNCVDDLIVQNNLLQVQYQEAAEQMQVQKPIIDHKERQILKLEQELHHLREEKEELLRTAVTASTSEISNSFDLEQKDHDTEMALVREQHELEIQSLQANLEASLLRVQELQQQLKKANGQPELSAQNTQLQAQNEEFRRIVTEKHEESVRYYNELQNVIAQLEQRDKSIADFGSHVANQSSLEAALEKERSEKEAREKELARLKSHMLLMEETSTAEAIEAEKREMELRAMVSDLQKSHHSATEGASEQSRVLELRVVDLTMRLDDAEKEADQWKSEAQTVERIRQETADALSSLQGVLKEISNDHEKESASYQHSCAQLQFKVDDLSNQITLVRDDLKRVKLEKQMVEDELEAAQRDITSRQKIIEDLENQVEDQKTVAQDGKTSYRIDDATLRSLFMSYFLAPVDKKPDIAILLASILQYPKEDVDKISAIFYPKGATGSVAKASQNSLSLTEQFVRFLENESESSRTAPQLPVDRREQRALQADVQTVRVPSSQCLDELLNK